MKKILLLITVLLLICSCGSKKIEKEIITEKIDCPTMKEKQSKGAILIDVRDETEYMLGSLDKAVNIPLSKIDTLIKNRVSDNTTPIIVFCQSGKRSAEAVEKLKELGYLEIYDLGSINNCSK